jgi:hypothetical protein
MAARDQARRRRILALRGAKGLRLYTCNEHNFAARSPLVVAADSLLWASANAASLLDVTAYLRKTAPPTSAVLEQIRENAMRSILSSETKGRSQ